MVKVNRTSEAKDKQRGETEFSTLSRFFNHEVVDSIVRRQFPEHQVAEILKILDDYQRDSEKISSRIHLAALKMSDGSAQRLRDYIHTAKQDFRDVIIPAENRRLHELGVVAYSRLTEKEKDRIATEDLNDYLAWIQKP